MHRFCTTQKHLLLGTSAIVSFLFVDSLAKKWAFQLKWGRSLSKQQSCLTTEEQQGLNLPELPLKNEVITSYLEAHKALCKKRTWATSCWMSIATLFLFSPSNLLRNKKDLAVLRCGGNGQQSTNRVGSFLFSKSNTNWY